MIHGEHVRVKESELTKEDAGRTGVLSHMRGDGETREWVVTMHDDLRDYVFLEEELETWDTTMPNN